MTSPLPFFSLDFKTSNAIFLKMNLKDMFLLSLCSKRAQNAIKKHTATLEKPITLSVCPSNGDVIVFSHRIHSLNFNFRTNRHVDFPDFKIMDNRVINKKKYVFVNPTTFISMDPELDTLDLSEYLIDTFSAEIRFLNCTPMDRECWQQLKNRKVFHESEHFWIESGKVSFDDMGFILKDLAAKSLDLSCYPGSDFTYHLPITQKQLSIHSSQWFSAKNLMEIRCSQLTLEKSGLTSADLKGFVDRWYTGDDNTLEFLKVNGVSETEDYDMDLITRDLRTIPGTPKRRSASSFQCLIYSGVDYEEGLDIKRPSDGMLATVQFVKSDRDQNFFLFVVWHDPNPHEV